MNPNLKRLCINLPFIIIDKIDDFAKLNGVNRTTAIIILINKGLENLNKNN